MKDRLFRVIDTGVRDGRFNVAIDQALIEAHKDGQIADTIRFLRFLPSVLIGRHQVLSSEVDCDFCARRGIEVGRRITGGGAIYLDENQLGWELVLDRSALGISSLADLTREICAAAADGLGRLGVQAAFRPRNDIEVGGRKLGGTGGFFDGSTIFFQGTVLIDIDPNVMFSALKVPYAKHAKHGKASPAARIVSLRELLGEARPEVEVLKKALVGGFVRRLGITARVGELTDDEVERAERIHRDEVGTDAFVREIDDPLADDGVATASLATTGGTVVVYVKSSGGSEPRIRSVLFTGDFFVTPPRVMLDLEAHLKDTRLDVVESTVDAFFSNAHVDTMSTTPAEFAAAIRAATNTRVLEGV